jgi:CheY-like chemotaxis protein
LTNFASPTILPVIAALVPALPKPRILVADDNPLSLRFFAEALDVLGYAIGEAADGALALDHANASAYDVLLLDAHMPNLGGAEVLARIRAQAGPSQHAIALATTADNDRATHAALRASGFADVLTKPLSIDALGTVLTRHAPNSAHATQARHDEALDDRQALAAAGGDAAIVAALRGLLVRELEAVPGEFASLGESEDANALRERLHRLDASAGFCGVPALLHAASALRAALGAPAWPHSAILEFIAACERVRVLLAR